MHTQVGEKLKLEHYLKSQIANLQLEWVTGFMLTNYCSIIILNIVLNIKFPYKILCDFTIENLLKLYYYVL